MTPAEPDKTHVPYLRFGHASAFVALLVTASASRYGPGVALPRHALGVLLALLPVRALLWSFQQPKVLTKSHYAIFLALGCAATFASSALHVVATRADPARLLHYVASSALDISALWLRMAATVKRPSRGAFPALFESAYGSADITLAAVVARCDVIARFVAPALCTRAALNACRLVAASRTILAVDYAKSR